MKTLEKMLFKRDKPVLRRFQPLTAGDAGDLPYLWDAYVKGMLKDSPEDMDMATFVEYIMDAVDQVPETWIVEDYVKGKREPIGVVFCGNDGWMLEPHVVYFDNATPRTILRTYVAFLKHTRWRKDLGACLLRVDSKTQNLAKRMEEMKLIEWVGKIWGGKPDGNWYLYSMRCNARRGK